MTTVLHFARMTLLILTAAFGVGLLLMRVGAYVLLWRWDRTHRRPL